MSITPHLGLNITNPNNEIVQTLIDLGDNMVTIDEYLLSHRTDRTMHGRLYPMTSSTPGVAIVDTDIVISGSKIFKVFVDGNPQAGGSYLYRTSTIGYIAITCGYTSATGVVRRINYHEIARFMGGSAGSGFGSYFTITPVFLVNGEEYTNINTNSSGILRIKVSGFQTGNEGHSLKVKVEEVF